MLFRSLSQSTILIPTRQQLFLLQTPSPPLILPQIQLVVRLRLLLLVILHFKFLILLPLAPPPKQRKTERTLTNPPRTTTLSLSNRIAHLSNALSIPPTNWDCRKWNGE